MSNTFNISVETKGGLGNVLFQIASAYAVSLENNANLIVDTTRHYGGHFGIGKYTTNILKKVVFSNEYLDYPVYSEGGFHYVTIPKFNENIKLSGYFQSEKYFKKYRKEIISFLEINEEISNLLKINFENILNNEETVSIHVRRGDYLHLQNFHPIQPIEYYKKSYDIFGDDKYYLIFSDDIEWCKNNFDFIKKKYFIENMEDYVSLYLMSLCKNNIIANSSFSWWGAWLNTNENKKVISPKLWFGEFNNNLITDDIYCKNWISL